MDDDGVLVIRRIAVSYRLQIPRESHPTAERVHGFHANVCPVARSIGGSIEIETELELV